MHNPQNAPKTPPVPPSDPPPPPPGLYPGNQSPYGLYGSPYGAEPSSFFSEFTPARALRIIRKKWMTLAVAAAFALVAWVIYSLITERQYEASSLIELSVRRPRIMNQQDAIIGDTMMRSFDEVMNTQLQKFRGRTMRLAALEELKANPAVQALNAEEQDEILRGQFQPVRFTVAKNTRLVQIIATHSSPQIAAALANAHAHAAFKVGLEENRQVSDSAVAWLITQAESQQRNLEQAEKALIDFRQEADLDKLNNDLQTAKSAISAYNQSLLDISSRLIQAREVVTTLDKVELVPEQIGGLPESLPRSDELKSVVSDWLAAITARDALLSRYTERHPEVLAKDQQIQSLRLNVQETLLRSRETAQALVNLLEQQAASLDKAKSEASDRSVALELTIANATMRQTTLEREKEAQDISYRGILKRIEEARLSSDENTAAITVVEEANAPKKPIHPNLIRTFGLALVGGLLVGFGIAVAGDQLEDFIVSVSEVENLLGQRVTGLIPHATEEQSSKLALIARDEPRSLIAEAYTGLRSMIDSLNQGGHTIKTTLITSSSPGTGKTTTSCNLAITRARGERRVLLIDFDLRRPRVLNALGLNEAGNAFLRYLKGESLDPARLTLPLDLTGQGQITDGPDAPGRLDIIASPVAAEQSAGDLIQSRRARELILWAQDNYDHVIIDSPPLGMIGDATALTGFAQAVIFLVRPEVSRKRATRSAVRHLREIGVHQLFPVMNDVDFSRQFYGDQSYGHYYADYR